jgi:hypothetical protein
MLQNISGDEMVKILTDRAGTHSAGGHGICVNPHAKWDSRLRGNDVLKSRE